MSFHRAFPNGRFRHTPSGFRLLAALAGASFIAWLIIRIGDALEAPDWPHRWEFHHRVRFGRLQHGRPEIMYYHPNGTWVALPYLAGLSPQLQSGDSLSKQLGTTRLYVLRDSADYRLTMQWAWNETTREFEFAGCTASIR